MSDPIDTTTFEHTKLRVKAAEQKRADIMAFFVGLAIFLVVITFIVVVFGGIVLNVRAGDARKDQSRLACIQAGHTWIAESCVAGK